MTKIQFLTHFSISLKSIVDTPKQLEMNENGKYISLNKNYGSLIQQQANLREMMTGAVITVAFQTFAGWRIRIANNVFEIVSRKFWNR